MIQNQCFHKKKLLIILLLLHMLYTLEDLHKIRPKLGKTSPPPEEIIGEENVKLYDKFNI